RDRAGHPDGERAAFQRGDLPVRRRLPGHAQGGARADLHHLVGFGMESKVVMAIAISFFPVVINTVVGLESVEENELLLMRSLVASRGQVFWKLAWPTALPSIFAGLKTSLTLALIGALVAEFVTAKEGLGTLITTFSFELKVYLVFAVIVVVSVLGLVLYGIMEVLERKIVFWRRSRFTG